MNFAYEILNLSLGITYGVNLEGAIFYTVGMEQRPHIMIVDDERAIGDLVASVLTPESMDTTVFTSGFDALAAMSTITFDLAIIDIMMPGIDGFELCTKIRAISSIPIIFLSAKDEEADKVIGFTLGGDDYITKPIRPRELVVRVKARLRGRIRSAEDGLMTRSALSPHSASLRHGDIELNPEAHWATLHGEPLQLTPKEFAILKLLLEAQGKPVSTATIFETVWNMPFDTSAANTIMVHIRRLRKKLAALDASTTFIETAWGIGYRMAQTPTNRQDA